MKTKSPGRRGNQKLFPRTTPLFRCRTRKWMRLRKLHGVKLPKRFGNAEPYGFMHLILNTTNVFFESVIIMILANQNTIVSHVSDLTR